MSTVPTPPFIFKFLAIILSMFVFPTPNSKFNSLEFKYSKYVVPAPVFITTLSKIYSLGIY